MKNSELLRQAKALIATEETFTTGYDARMANGAPTYAQSPSAVCFCAMGALKRVAGLERDENDITYYLAMGLGLKKVAGLEAISIPEVNDSYGGFELIHKGFDRAIALAERDESDAAFAGQGDK